MRRHRVTFYSQDAQLKEISADDPERYGRWSFACERAAIRRLDRAFQGFFRRVKAGERPGYPRFKGRGWRDSVEWPAEDGGLKLLGVSRAFDDDLVRDVTEILTSLCARLHEQRAAANRARRAVEAATSGG